MSSEIAEAAANAAVAQATKAMTPAGQISRRSASIPSALGWDQTAFPLSISVSGQIGSRRRGSVTYDPTSKAWYQACLAGPQIYVSRAGNDTTGDGSQGNPYKTHLKAVQVANTGGVPCAIHSLSAGGEFSRQNGGPITTAPTVDVVFIAHGRAKLSVADTYTWTADTTYPNVFKITRSQFARAVNPKVLNRFGLATEYVSVGSLARCAVTPGSTYTDGTTVYVFPHNGEDASDANVRVFLAVSLVRMQSVASPKNLAFVPYSSGDGYDFEGGTGGFYYSATGLPAQPIDIYLKNCTSRFTGNNAEGNPGSNGYRFEGVHGLVFLDNCSAGGVGADGVNFHNALGATMYALTLNCSAVDCGRGTSQSNNGWTSHENVVAIDVGGDYSWTYGNVFHTIGTTKTYVVGARVAGSFGDVALGGSYAPNLLRSEDAAQIWAEEVELVPSNYATGVLTATGTSALRYRNMLIPGLVTADATATVSTY